MYAKQETLHAYLLMYYNNRTLFQVIDCVLCMLARDKPVYVIPHSAVGLMLHGKVEKGRRHTKDLVKSRVYLPRPCKTQTQYKRCICFCTGWLDNVWCHLWSLY